MLSHPSDPLVQANAALHSYATAYWWAAGFFTAGAVITALLFRRKGSDQPAPAVSASAATDTVPLVNGLVHGTVVGSSHAVIHGRILDGAGTPLPHAVITLLDPAGRQLARATAGEDGSYAVDTPVHRGAVLVCSAPARQPQVTTLTVGSGPIAFDMVMLPARGRLVGTVRDSDGNPLAGALVVVTEQRDGAAATTSVEGHYQFDDLTPGHYTVTVNAPGHGLANETVIVSGEGSRCDFALRRTANLRGTVHGRDGRPARDARVILLDATGDVVATRATTDDGTYSFTELADREYTLIATGYPPVATPITLNGDSHNRFDVFLGNGMT